jgi:hypothetical protein
VQPSLFSVLALFDKMSKLEFEHAILFQAFLFGQAGGAGGYGLGLDGDQDIAMYLALHMSERTIQLSFGHLFSLCCESGFGLRSQCRIGGKVFTFKETMRCGNKVMANCMQWGSGA